MLHPGSTHSPSARDNSRQHRPVGFGFRNMIDSEPDRCRRTDGKKWRCSKEVIPGEKYCAQHIHRGRKRSRKPVETSQTVPVSDKRQACNSSTSSADLRAGYSVSTFVTPPPKLPAPTDISFTSKVPRTTSGNLEANTTIANGTVRKVNSNCPSSSGTSVAQRNTWTAIYTTLVFVDSTTVATKNSKSNSIEVKRPDVDDRNRRRNSSVAQSTASLKSSGPSSTKASGNGLDFSRTSVLQDCSGSCYYNVGNLEADVQRCRRTDGKRWRCRRHVVLNQKYCERHIHRGAKKSVDASQPATSRVTFPAVSTGVSTHPTTTLTDKANCSRLNCNISNEERQRLMTDGDISPSSSSSGTTISDTGIALNKSK